MKRLKKMSFFSLGMLAVLVCLSPVPALAEDVPSVAEETPQKTEEMVSKSELTALKAEWEAVREQQIQMIREKEDQLEKLKEEIFAKMKEAKAPAAPVVTPAAVPDAAPGSLAEIEAQKEALKVDRQKFFNEMNRQKESLRRLQASLDEKAKQLEAERGRFEQEKKAAGR